MTKKTAFVTGGVGGIGSAICRELAHRAHQVVAGYHPAEEQAAQARLAEWRAEGLAIDIVSGDVGSFSSCVDMAKAVQEKLAHVDVLVNCAGITRDKTLKKMSEEDWQAVINVDLNSLFNVTKQFADGMAERGYGRIVNISSVNGKKGQFGQTNYSAAKAGVHGFTMALAQEVARKGVTVNSVSPGYCRTHMVMQVPEQVRNEIVSKIPVGRLGEPHEIARVVEFLSAEDAGYITGANVPVNGGYFMTS